MPYSRDKVASPSGNVAMTGPRGRAVPLESTALAVGTGMLLPAMHTGAAGAAVFSATLENLSSASLDAIGGSRL